MRSLSISRKTTIAALAVLALCATSSGAGMWVAFKLSNGIDRAIQSGAVLRNHMGADQSHDALRADVYSALLAVDPAMQLSIDDAEKELKEHTEEFEKFIANNEAAEVTPQTRELLARVRGPLKEYIAGAGRILDVSKTDIEAAKVQMPAFFELFKTLEKAMAEVSDAVSEAAQADADEAKQKAAQAKYLMGGLLALGIAFALALSIVAQNVIVHPIRNITRALDRLAKGDLDTKVPSIKSNDEIGLMARALAVFKEAMQGRQSEVEARQQRERADAERLRHEAEQRLAEEERNGVVAALAEALDQLAAGRFTFRIAQNFPVEYAKLRDDFNAAIASLDGVVRTIARAAEATRLGTTEIAGGAEDLSQRTASQAASLEQIVAALDAMTGGFRSTAQGAEKARQSVGDVRGDAQKSGEIVNRAVQAMSAIHSSATEVAKIIVVIDEIAFQTSLLALNAGVEAARAGDAGRGFAVVAQEVRALAQRSAESAKEIKGLISASTQQVDMGVSLVGETGQALARMAGKVGEIDALVCDIAASAQDQAQRLAEINSSANQMDRATRQNAAMAEEMTTVGRNLSGEADGLSKLVGRFGVSESTHRNQDWRIAS